MKRKSLVCLAVATAVLQVSTTALAAVSAEEASQLKTTLTPLGGEKAGNKDGSIPAWTDGSNTKYGGPRFGDVPANLFPSEKPIMQISNSNMAQYAGKLSDGTQALLKKYPETFRVNVLPTHRTAVAPQYIYDNTFKNATHCKTVKEGMSVEACFGGIPFPVPKSGIEVLWNYLLRVEPESVEFASKNIVSTANGARTVATQTDSYFQHPYYYKEGSAKSWSGEYFIQRFNTTAPPFKAGESLVVRDSINADVPRQAWQYLVGQRRVRRAPTVAYDTPDFVSSGANYFDEVMGFMGHPDRFAWKLIGKKEMYIPYNNNELVTAKETEAFDKFHINSNKLRWELHRVWEVEATVVSGKRHAVPKRKYYFDEDTWLLALVDGYDSEGRLWRTSVVPNFYVPAVPAIVTKPATIYNLQAGTMSTVQGLFQDMVYRVVPRKNESIFTGDAAAADADR